MHAVCECFFRLGRERAVSRAAQHSFLAAMHSFLAATHSFLAAIIPFFGCNAFLCHVSKRSGSRLYAHLCDAVVLLDVGVKKGRRLYREARAAA